MQNMRRIIFKEEIHFAFKESGITESEQQLILSGLFKDPFEFQKNYKLKDDLENISDIQKIIDKSVKNEAIKRIITSIFLVSDDLILQRDVKYKFVNNESIAVFVGAGVSRLLDYPLWEELGKRSIEFLLRSGKINYFDHERILSDIKNPKEKLTIFHQIFKKSSQESIEFYQKNLNLDTSSRKNNLYNSIIKFDWLKLTSNLDNEFYKALCLGREKELSNDENYPQKVTRGFDANIELSNHNIYYLHGSIDDLEETVITTKDYINAYYKGDSSFQNFLRTIFKDFTVIFIGYSLQEFELLEKLIKSDKNH
jgi:hypothetical protein